MASVVERFFLDEVNPSDEELLRGGYSSVPEPYKDFLVRIGPMRQSYSSGGKSSSSS